MQCTHNIFIIKVCSHLSSQLTTNAASVAIATAVRAPESDTLSLVDSGIMGIRLSLITVSTEGGSLWDVVNYVRLKVN